MAASMGASAVNRLISKTRPINLLCMHRSLTQVTGNERIDNTLDTVTRGKIGGWLQKYENIVGLSEVRDAQDKVIRAENEFQEAQKSRREHQKSVIGIHAKMKDLHAQLDKVQRGDEKYLALLTEEYEFMKQEKQLQGDLSALEELERTNFSVLSSAVRESHEKERTRTERTKYWSIGGSMVGALIGILGASLNNYLRNREIRRIMHESAKGGKELRSMIAELAFSTQTQHDHIEGFVNEMKNVKMTPLKSNDNFVAEMQQHDSALIREMQDIRKILIGSKSSDQLSGIVYVGPEIESLLVTTEKNLESKMKMNAIFGSLFTAVAVPVAYWFFKGN